MHYWYIQIATDLYIFGKFYFMPDTVPIISPTLAAYDIKTISIKTAGNITSDGGQAITERGICYALFAAPTTSNSKIIDPLIEAGSYTAELTSLTLNTTYYARAYAINSIGTGYGAEISFKTLQTPSIQEVKELNFGYLTGEDLLRYVQYQMLIKNAAIDIDSLQYAVNVAYSRIKANCETLYDIDNEFTHTGSDRSLFTVEITAKLAIEVLLSNSMQISDFHKDMFEKLANTLVAIRSGQLTLPNLNIASTDKYSDVTIVTSSFRTLD